MNSILQSGKMRVENQTKTRIWKYPSLCQVTSTKTAVQEFHKWRTERNDFRRQGSILKKIEDLQLYDRKADIILMLEDF
jgi:hypothetical protein